MYETIARKKRLLSTSPFGDRINQQISLYLSLWCVGVLDRERDHAHTVQILPAVEPKKLISSEPGM